MGNGKPAEVHTTLFNKIFEVFEISEEELERSLTATSLLNGNSRSCCAATARCTRRPWASWG